MLKTAAWPEEKYASPIQAQAVRFQNLEVPVYLYFIRNSRSHDFMKDDAQNNAAYQAILDAYQPRQAACFSASDYEEYGTLFYATDHHWNHRGADQGYRDIIRLLLGEEEETLPVKEEIMMIPACIGCLPVGKWLQGKLPDNAAAAWMRAAADVLLFALCIFMLLGSTYNPFIYFRF